MKSDAKQNDEIERYLHGEMDAEELRAFENLLSEDENLRKEVDLHQDLAVGIKLFGAENLKKQLQSSETESLASPFQTVHTNNTDSAEGKGKARPLTFFLAVAASFVLVLVAVWLLNPGGNAQELYAAYYEPYPNVIDPVERSGVTSSDPASRAMDFYEKGNYEEAIALFTTELPPDDPAYRFYLGVCYLGLQEFYQAEQVFQPLLEDQAGPFYQESLWYTSLAKLAQEQPGAAQESLIQLTNLQGEYAIEAQRLLEELD